MLRSWLPLFIGIGWLLLITALVGFIPPRFPPPDVAIIVVVVFSFRYALSLGGFFSFVLGILQDILAGGIIGLNALSKTVVFYFSRALAKRIYVPNITAKIAMVLVGVIVDSLIIVTALFILGDIHSTISHFLYYLLLQICCTGLLSPFILIIMTKIPSLEEKDQGNGFHYGHPKARTRGI